MLYKDIFITIVHITLCVFKKLQSHNFRVSTSYRPYTENTHRTPETHMVRVEGHSVIDPRSSGKFVGVCTLFRL